MPGSFTNGLVADVIGLCKADRVSLTVEGCCAGGAPREGGGFGRGGGEGGFGRGGGGGDKAGAPAGYTPQFS